MTENNFKLIEVLLLRLLLLLKVVFTDSETQEVQDFIDVGEYGIALETLVEIIIEESKLISIEALDLIKKIAVLLELDDKGFQAKLSTCVRID
jgi:hypothetical protein